MAETRSTEEFKLIRNERGKSAMWLRFGQKKRISDGKIETDLAVCFHCNSEVKVSGGTTNMTTHVRRHHPAMLTKTPGEKKSLQTVQEEPASVNATASDAAIAPKRTMQATLEQSFQPPVLLRHSS